MLPQKIYTNVDGNSVTDPIGIANSMNQFFCNVGDELSKDIPDTKNSLLMGEHTINPSNATFIFASVVSEQVALAINKIKTSHGYGLDEISSFFLKIAMPVLAEHPEAAFQFVIVGWSFSRSMENCQDCSYLQGRTQ